MNAARAALPQLVEGFGCDLGEVMATMEAAFDPMFGEAWTRSQCAGIMGLPGVWLILARNGREGAGFALARAVFDEAELLLLAVRPGHRRSGIGGALLNGVVEEAQRRGARQLHLEMREGNPAGALYAGFGFAEVGRRRAYYRGRNGERWDAITLTRPV
jgi:ribosomal-protein-alanine N-acetyltransferase